VDEKQRFLKISGLAAIKLIAATGLGDENDGFQYADSGPPRPYERSTHDAIR
jgi:hypothetical protein